MTNQNILSKSIPGIPVAYAANEHVTGKQEIQMETGHTATTDHGSEEGGLSLDPSIIAIQMLNFLVLLIILWILLYKPLLKILHDREKRINDGLENAERADRMIAESEQTRLEKIKMAKIESQKILEDARKSGEKNRASIVQDAEKEAAKLIQNGRNVIDLERTKAEQELKVQAVDLIIQTAEKVLREKLDPLHDQKIIEESLKKYSAT